MSLIRSELWVRSSDSHSCHIQDGFNTSCRECTLDGCQIGQLTLQTACLQA